MGPDDYERPVSYDQSSQHDEMVHENYGMLEKIAAVQPSFAANGQIRYGGRYTPAYLDDDPDA